jgi:ABC-type branched-subunit amino acid transport system substrate-binding protein
VPAVAEPTDLKSADSMVTLRPSQGRDRALKRWAEQRASLTDLVYVLRRPASELGSAEAFLTAAALAHTPASREALHRRLLARLKLADPNRARSAARDRGGLEAAPPPHLGASVFRVASLLPDSGAYQSYGRAVLKGISAGLAQPVPGIASPLDLEFLSTGDDEPSRAVAAFDSVADRAGGVMGELLSVPTLVLATAARYASLPLVSPSATDEGVGAVSPTAFQVGPSGFTRGSRLASGVLDGRPRRVGILVSNASEGSSFALGFAAAAERMNAPVVWRDVYAAGSLNFRDEVRALVVNQVEILFWDGEAREAEALVRQLARDRVSLRLCGGEGLAPEQHHVETRVLLEGVLYVGEDWQLGAAVQARLDSLVAPEESERVGSLVVRGYLAGRMLRAAVAGGALCPEEITAFLASHTEQEPYLHARRFLDLGEEDVVLPVYTVTRGRGVPVP